MSETAKNHDGITTCTECDGPMYANEEWQITDRSLIGTKIGSEGIGGYYAHVRCLDTNTDQSD